MTRIFLGYGLELFSGSTCTSFIIIVVLYRTHKEWLLRQEARVLVGNMGCLLVWL
ncbi:hypothetical protein BDV37DRAFT_244692 [Aspergillus pseudonomiae]|uniref:Uncharacterized protein n=1 Tax=Aspergillus pseudonomiae TaxID=1506151 RepID=A0A5N7DI47_9EURO|nr:uncharacterized protein BDV37DRAFT_244692 [Aspergillus pseudonomiae]KAE8405799.1 hypothetical protein BDV37DRAFT_244692 [Aspergillus pseudonomiae]